MNIPNWIKNFGKVDETEMTEDNFLKGYRSIAFRLLATIIIIATIVGLTESFDGLYIWFSTHGVTGIWADVAPLMLDSFSVIGELAIFTAITGHWAWQKRVLPWVSVILGLTGSVAGNVGHVAANHPVTWDLTAMVPPLAGAFGILIGFSVLKSLAKEKADRAYRAKLVISSEIIKPDLAASTEGLKELEEEKSEARTPRLEAPKLPGLDALIPPRTEPEAAPVDQPAFEADPLPGMEPGNTQTEWMGFNPNDPFKERDADLRMKIRNTGQFSQV